MKKAILFFAVLAFLSVENRAQTVTDYDGNAYDTVLIGTQVWLKQNLRTTHDNNGTPVPKITDSSSWANMSSMARCYYNNDSAAYDSVYGPLYNWYVAHDPNICPLGWHVSTNAEWLALETYLGGGMIAGGKMKEADTIHWASPNTGATNSSGFTGLPGGGRDLNSNFNFFTQNGLFWTATAYNTSSAWGTYLWYLSTGVEHDPVPKTYGVNIRCVKDAGSGINGIHEDHGIKLFPNPANDIITFDLADSKECQLLVYDILGACVMQHWMGQNDKTIDISSLPCGIYVIRLIGETYTAEQKLVKE